MSSAPREAMVPLTRWQYFTKTLYHNAAAKTRFVYNKVVYEKDEALQKIEEGNGRINMGLLLVLLAMFLTASTVQNIYIIVAGMVVIAAGELVRLLPFTLKEVIIGYEQFGEFFAGLVLLSHTMHPFEIEKVIFLI